MNNGDCPRIPATAEGAVRCTLRVRGVVQGVGFRPFVFRLATALGLRGWVRNEPGSVAIVAEGPRERLESFASRLRSEAPALARIDGLEVAWSDAHGLAAFAIRPTLQGSAPTPVPADVATCEACLHEMADPADRRHAYPFINCTDCGPRFTLIRGMPYDRSRTTMDSFPLCDDCRAEYGDPASRRFHAEPVACPACGPRLRLLEADGTPVDAEDPVAAAAARLRAGQLLAVKGLGGWHLCCDARQEPAVGRLRAVKQRDGKAFAVMVPDLATARTLARVDDDEAALLRSVARPVVLLDRLAGCDLAHSVAPGTARVGLMLPYAPLHPLLLAAGPFGALVLTSANPHDEPICRDDDEALARLAGLADGFLAHDRPIVARCDDSVALVAGGRPRLVRRSRGYVPLAVPLPRSGPPVLAAGADLKNAFCVTRDDLAYPGPHVGDLQNEATAAYFEEAAAHLCDLLSVRPEVVAHDLHPDHLSTRLAMRLRDRLWPGARRVAVQHHHAHALSCLAEHGTAGPALALALDGTGLGTDGTIWGGEVLAVDGASFRRLAHLRALPLPGGDNAARDPWRCAAAFLAAGGAGDLLAGLAARWSVDPDRVALVARLAREAPDVPRTSGLGRAYDAMAAVAGLRAGPCFEGEAAIAVEEAAARAEPGERVAQAWVRATDAAGLPVADLSPTLGALARVLAAGLPPDAACARFEATVVDALVALARDAAAGAGLDTVALCGGAMQNRYLLRELTGRLSGAGLRVLSPAALPAGDGGLAVGQALAALCGGT